MDLTEMPETESQKQKLIDSLRELDIDFEIGKDSVRIKGLAGSVCCGHITVYQIPDKKIVFEELGDANRIILNSTDETRPGIKQILLDKTVYARYDFPYLIIQF
jgi:hypothetical protein